MCFGCDQTGEKTEYAKKPVASFNGKAKQSVSKQKTQRHHVVQTKVVEIDVPRNKYNNTKRHRKQTC